MKKLILAVAIAAATLATGAQAAVSAYEYSTHDLGQDDRPFTIGFGFSLSQATNIEALGYNTANLPDDRAVGLWTASGTLITSTVVLTSDPVSGHFAYADIDDVLLGPGDYVIAGVFEGGAAVVNQTGVTSALPGYTWLYSLQISGPGLNFPTGNTGSDYGQNGIAMVNFLASSAVPEPASWALMIGGFALAGGAMRRRKIAVAFA